MNLKLDHTSKTMIYCVLFSSKMKQFLSILVVLKIASGAPLGDSLEDNVFLGHEREISSLDKVGQGVDAGPSDIGHELHAKMEEAAQKALAIIEHAGKYLDDAAKEQSKRDAIEPYNAKDFKSSEMDRAKREVEPVPQTNSDAAKGGQKVKRSVGNFDHAFWKNKKKSNKETVSSAEDDMLGTPHYPSVGAVGAGDTDWWNVESGLNPEKLDQIIDAVNKFNEIFTTFIEKYDEAHGTSPTDSPDIRFSSAEDKPESMENIENDEESTVEENEEEPEEEEEESEPEEVEEEQEEEENMEDEEAEEDDEEVR